MSQTVCNSCKFRTILSAYPCSINVEVASTTTCRSNDIEVANDVMVNECPAVEVVVNARNVDVAVGNSMDVESVDVVGSDNVAIADTGGVEVVVDTRNVDVAVAMMTMMTSKMMTMAMMTRMTMTMTVMTMNTMMTMVFCA